MQENRQEKSPIKKRILHYLDLKGITKYAFYRDSGVTRGILDHPTGISEDNITKFLSFAQDISPVWLLTGEGKIFTAQKTENKKGSILPLKDPPKGHIYQFDSISDLVGDPDTPYLTAEGGIAVPIVELSSVIRQNTGYTEPTDSITLPGRLLKPGLHACIAVQGQAMKPTLQEGGFLICRSLESDERKKLKDMQVYVVVSEAGETFVRRIKSDGATLVCMADNPDKSAFADFRLRPTQILKLWEVEWYFSDKLPNILDSYSGRLQGLEEDIDSLKRELSTLTKTLKST